MLGDLYVSLANMKVYLGIASTDTADDANLTAALTAICREIETGICGRQFNDAGTVSARVYRPDHRTMVTVDDFSTTTGLIVATDDNGDGVYETTWDAGDYQVEPLNGIVGGQPGWPYWTIRAVGSRRFPILGSRAGVQATARWGWAAVPSPVDQAVKLAANEVFALKDARFGVAGWDQFGSIRVRQNPFIAALLQPYVLDSVMVA